MARRTVGLIGCGLLVGMLIGWMGARRSELSHQEIRTAAERLVPAGMRVTEAAQGHIGDFPPPKGPYFVSLSVEGEHDVDRRVRTFGSIATQQGWTIEATETRPGAVVQHLRRGDLSGRIHVFLTGTTKLKVEYPNQIGHVLIITLLGALSGGVAGTIAAMWLRRRGQPELTSPTPAR